MRFYLCGTGKSRKFVPVPSRGKNLGGFFVFCGEKERINTMEYQKTYDGEGLKGALWTLAGTSLFSTTRSAPITINVQVGDKTVYHGTNATSV